MCNSLCIILGVEKACAGGGAGDVIDNNRKVLRTLPVQATWRWQRWYFIVRRVTRAALSSLYAALSHVTRSIKRTGLWRRIARVSLSSVLNFCQRHLCTSGWIEKSILVSSVFAYVCVSRARARYRTVKDAIWKKFVSLKGLQQVDRKWIISLGLITRSARTAQILFPLIHVRSIDRSVFFFIPH